MILTCPECATGYLVDDAQVPSAGRQVRCSACGTRWTAYPTPQPPLELVPSAPEAASSKPAAPARPAIASLPGVELPRVFRDRVEEERRLRRAALSGAGWAAALLVVAAAAVAAILFREPVVRAWPQAASVYAAVGFPVNATGLAIEHVAAEPSLEAGHATLDVTGVIRNVTGHEVTAPPLRISLLNGQGKRVAGQIATLANARIPPGEQRRFSTAIFDPPFSAASLQVDFVLGPRPGGASRAPAGASQDPIVSAPPATALRGPSAGPEPPASPGSPPST